MSKISELSDGGSLVSSDYLIAVRSGGNVKVRMDQINVDQVDLGDNEFIRLGNSQDLTMVHTSTQSIINQAGTGDLLLQKAGTTKASITANGLEFPENAKAIFGAGSDLQIYHDGSNSFIQESGTGDLKIRSNKIRMEAPDSQNMIIVTEDAGVQAFYNGTERLSVTNTGIDVTGTVTADGLTVANTGAPALRVQDTDGTNQYIDLGNNGGITSYVARNNTTNGSHLFYGYDGTNFSQRFNIASNGDVSLYEDTGTTPKFFWDASAESLGIGTSSPSAPLTILSTGWKHLNLTSTDSNSANKAGYVTVSHYTNAEESFGMLLGQSTVSANILNIGGGGGGLNAATSINLYTAANNTTVTGTPRVSIDATGRVGIGRTPSLTNSKLEVGGADNVSLINVEASGVTGGMGIGSTGLQFFHGSSAKMRIDASGNLLVGKSASSFTTAGVELAQGGTAGKVQIQRPSSPLALVNLTDDGDILNFYKGTSAVGSWQSRAGAVSTIILDPRAGGRGLSAGSNSIVATDQNGTLSNGATDIGEQNFKFRNAYLSGGVYLGGTGAANKLDDYEEGTWTPTVTSSVGTITSVTSQIGTYTKIGRLVTLQYQFNIATLGTASGNCIVSGMPFTEDNTEITYYAGVHRARSGASSITEFDPSGTLQLYGTTPVAGTYFGSMVYNTTS